MSLFLFELYNLFFLFIFLNFFEFIQKSVSFIFVTLVFGVHTLGTFTFVILKVNRSSICFSIKPNIIIMIIIIIILVSYRFRNLRCLVM